MINCPRCGDTISRPVPKCVPKRTRKENEKYFYSSKDQAEDYLVGNLIKI
jgi:hypothetical protein